MIKHSEIIQNSILFKNSSIENIYSMLQCLNAQVKTYSKEHYIFETGEIISSVGMVLNGSVHVVKDDFWGNRAIISEVYPGQIFGETYASLIHEPLGVSVIASKKCDIMFIDIRRIMKVCSSSCQFHTNLIQNFLMVMAETNLILTKKIEHITKRTTKEKLLSYLSEQSAKNESSSFEIPFNRQQLADYLSVDRSSMSNELSKLKNEGILEFEKNYFFLKKS